MLVIAANDLQHQLQSFKMILCDEATSRVNERLLDNLREDQHSVLFTVEKKKKVDKRLEEQFLLRTCLRSTSQLAWFANTYHLRQLESFSVHIAFPSKTFHAETSDIKWVDGNSHGNDFIKKSIDTIDKLAAEDGLDFVVVPLIPKELLQGLLDELSGVYACRVDAALVEKKNPVAMQSSEIIQRSSKVMKLQ